jgi:RimJ/RimL family protein N-acetyltransferase
MVIYLRKIKHQDLDIFKKYSNDEEIHRYNPYDVYNKATEMGLDNFIHDDNESRYVICLKNSDEIIGDIGERKVPGSTEIKIGLTIFRKDLWGKGIGYQAIVQLLGILKTRNVKKVILSVEKLNERALSLYKKVGFTIYSEEDDKYRMSIQL